MGINRNHHHDGKNSYLQYAYEEKGTKWQHYKKMNFLRVAVSPSRNLYLIQLFSFLSSI